MDTIWIIVWVLVAGGAFAWLWRGGYLVRLSTYVRLTMEELKKCTWPSWDELRGHTVVVAISIALLGVYTFAIDRILFGLFTFFRI